MINGPENKYVEKLGELVIILTAWRKCVSGVPMFLAHTLFLVFNGMSGKRIKEQLAPRSVVIYSGCSLKFKMIELSWGGGVPEL